MTDSTGKAAWREREFLLSLAGMIAASATAQWMAFAVIVSAYALSRGIAKHGGAA